MAKSKGVDELDGLERLDSLVFFNFRKVKKLYESS